MKTITTEELQKRVEAGEQLNIIDVREADEVAAGMIPGAKHIPLGEVESRVSELDKEKPYYVVCRSGGRSGQAGAFLNGQGIDATNVEGGMLNWNGETQA
ncbi:MAG TPA: rhodanese-like domain-containing protein [Planococcus sp. (in: firmicutes)]|nr:rhodanese-like domain-containing protein [Planococcus sp. (in: firmicutes)]